MWRWGWSCLTLKKGKIWLFAHFPIHSQCTKFAFAQLQSKVFLGFTSLATILPLHKGFISIVIFTERLNYYLMSFVSTKDSCTSSNDNVWCIQETDGPYMSCDPIQSLSDTKSLGSSASIRTSIFHGDGAEVDNNEERKGNHALISNLWN